jgi:hypothetical protein
MATKRRQPQPPEDSGHAIHGQREQPFIIDNDLGMNIEGLGRSLVFSFLTWMRLHCCPSNTLYTFPVGE